VVAGCHSSSSGQRGDAAADGAAGASGGDPTTPDGFCRSYYAIVADFFARCDGVPLSIAQMIVDDPLLCQKFDASVAAHRTSFDPTHAQACLDSFAAAFTCSSSGSTSTIPVECAAVAPLVPVGGTCKDFNVGFLPAECMNSSYCKRGPNDSCDGTCTAPAAVGAPCDLLKDIRCAANLVCDSTSKTCVARLPAGSTGASCDDKTPCATGLYCDTGGDAGSGAKGTCQTRKSSGPCKASTDCALPAHCAGPVGARTCAQPKHAGDSCTPGQNECDLATICDASHKCSDTFAPIGQPCGPQAQSDNVPCAKGAYCDATPLQPGTCRAIKQPGDACTGTALFECGGNDAFCDGTSHQCVACPI